ncbi:hypothetical protein [Hydrogenimonas urashimensis]|uniref:hypothetical protein n=1 Tax=Hydrogenimonas urashimensis TaxID=2740515 RepID=UPI0019168638|nr:hypothetical protein [Hydrogenimonas urashimensis]
MAYTLDDIYGCTIDEYAKALGKTVDGLIEEKYREIELLEKHVDDLMPQRDRSMNATNLIRHIHGVIHSKRKKIDRFEKWKRRRNG